LKLTTISAAFILVTAFALLRGNPVFAASTPKDYGAAGGTISGTVVGPSGTVLDWGQIYANNGNQTFEAFSGFSGFYLMRVPAGTYNVSVYDPYNPQYWAPNANVTVTDGSSSTVDFYLQQQPPSTVPEFQPTLAALVIALTVAITCITLRRAKR
jgi:hypothetical protein